MDSTKLDSATEILEDIRRLHQKMNDLNKEGLLRGREFSLAITDVETAKLWIQEIVVNAQNSR